MRYIYSLTDSGCVFYIGMAKDLTKRYKSHIKPSIATNVSFFIYDLITVHNRFPEMHVIEYLPIKEAIKREREIISILAQAGHKLLNNTYYDLQCKFSPSIPPLNSLPEQLNAIQHRIDVFMYYYKLWNKISPNTFFPKNPFK